MCRNILFILLLANTLGYSDFGLPKDIYLGSDPKEINIADIDNDGNKDIIFVENGAIKILTQSSSESSHYSVLLDGTNEHFQLESSTELKQSDCTLSFWVKPVDDGNPSSYKYLWRSEAIQIAYHPITNSLICTFFNDLGTFASIGYSGVNLDTSTWSNIIVTHESVAGEAKIFINGELKRTQVLNGTSTLLNNGDLIRIGGGQGYGFSGYMDDISFFSKALSEVEVLQVFNFKEYVDLTTLGFSSDLVSWWTMGDDESDIFNGYFDPSLLKDVYGTNDGSPIDTEPSDKVSTSYSE